MLRVHSIDEALTDAGAAQDGFVVTATLRQFGISKRRAQSCRDRGRLHHIIGDVSHVSLRREQLSPRQWMRARWLAAGPDAALTRVAAEAVAGGTRFGCGGHLHILVPQRRRIAIPDATIQAVPDSDPTDVRFVDGFRLTHAARSIAGFGRDFTGDIARYQIANAIHAAEYRDRTTTLAVDIADELVDHRHVGAPVVRAALDLYQAHSIGTRSRTEDRYVAMALSAHPCPPLVNTVHELFGRTVEVDLFYPGELVRVEIQGGQHGRIHDTAVDHVRDVDFADAGFTVISEDWRTVWRDISGCRTRLLRALERSGVRRNR